MIYYIMLLANIVVQTHTCIYIKINATISIAKLSPNTDYFHDHPPSYQPSNSSPINKKIKE